MSKNITLTLSEKEVELLCELVYMGEWMVNANKGSDHNEKYQAIMKKVFNLSKDPAVVKRFPFDDIELNTNRVAELYQEFIHDYNEDNFWVVLPEKLAERDAFLKAGEKKFAALPEKERTRLKDLEVDRYYDEVEKHGLSRLFIKE